jgi:L-aminopeptidase/D-esterase-like protein
MFPEWAKPQALARRTVIGLGRDGSFSGDGYGDSFIIAISTGLPSPLLIAFSTANPAAGKPSALHQVSVFLLAKRRTRPGSLGTVPATEEPIINARVAVRAMTDIHDWHP